MFQYIVAVVVVFLAVIYPVMLAARMVGAGRTGPGAALVAVLLQFVFGVAIRLVVNDPLLQGIAAVLVGCAIYSFILQTSILRGFAISVIAVVVGLLVLFLFVGLGGVYLSLGN